MADYHFERIARTPQSESWRVETDEAFEVALTEAAASRETALIEVVLGEPPSVATV